MQVSREVLLSQLDSVYPGISSKDIIEQGSCFAFQDGKVFSFNDEVACQCECDIGFTGAIQAEPLLRILRKLEEDELGITVTEGEIIIKGKKRRSGLRYESAITLPISAIEQPGKWKSLNPEFTEAVDVVKNTASKDQTAFALTCVHITPEYVESTDNIQISRYKLETGFDSNFLLRRESVQHIVGLGMSKFSVTKSWVHFKNKRGLIFSCRSHDAQFPDTSGPLKAKGSAATLPKGLSKAAETAEVFSSENDDNMVVVELRTGKVKLSGHGVSGWHEEVKKMNYDGPDIKFMIAPALLSRITAQHNECQITDSILKVIEGKYTYVTCLHKDDKDDKDDSSGGSD